MALVFKCAGRTVRLCNGAATARASFVRFSSVQDKKGLVLGVYSKEEHLELSETAKEVDGKTEGKLSRQIKLTGNSFKVGTSLLLWDVHPEFQAVAVTGLGAKNPKENALENLDEAKENVRLAASAACKTLDSAGIKNIFLESLGNAESCAESSTLSLWKYQKFRTKKEPEAKVKHFSNQQDSSWTKGCIKGEAQNLARKLAETPANHLTPKIFSEEVKRLLTPLGLEVQVYDETWAKNNKMEAFLSVAQGSKEPPRFVEVSYSKGTKDQAPIVLVGKGVTFDAGGISIKPSKDMDVMRADMGGAASLVGAVFGVARLEVPLNLVLLIPMVENLPSGSALKPGDVITASNGKTICVDNTDAEGRLILADALVYSSKFNPSAVVDVATLTGAMVVCLGNIATGVFSNNNPLYELLQQAGHSTGDRVWRLPLWKEFSKSIKECPSYDLNNIGKGPGGGSCSAAAFLQEFIPENTPWMHMDIASVMGPQNCSPYLCKGMSGRPTRTLIEFLKNYAKNYGSLKM